MCFVVFSACLACGLGVSVDLFFCLGACVVLCLVVFFDAVVVGFGFE